MFNIPLIKTSLKNSTQVIIKFIISFINIKVIAVLIGPQGMATLGLFQNTLQIGSGISLLGFSNGIIKYMAEYKNNISKQNSLYSTALISSISIASLLGIITLIFGNSISLLIFESTEYSRIIRLSGFHFISSSILTLTSAALNGQKRLKFYIFLNIFLSISGFLICLGAILFNGLKGLMLAQVIAPILATIYAAYLIKYKLKLKLVKPDWLHIKRLSNFSLMNLTAAVFTPLTLLLVRGIIIQETSLECAGWWEGLNKVSTSYTMLITASFSYYFLPKFTELKSKKNINSEIIKTLKTLIPILILGSTSIFFLKDLIIKILFDSSFNGMKPYFIWQVMGDVFKVIAWIFATFLIAKGRTKSFIISEVLSSLMIVTLAYVLINYGQENNLTLYYFIENVVYLMILVLLYLKEIRSIV